MLSPFWRRSAMQPGRHLGSEEGILGSCSVVQKIMSVPCGAVSGDRSQMQPLLYGRLSFSAENSLPPSQTSTKTFSGYCGSLRLKREEKARGKKRLSLSPPHSFPPAGSLRGAGGSNDRAFTIRGAQAPLVAPTHCENTAEHGEPPPGKRGAAGNGAAAGVVSGVRPSSRGRVSQPGGGCQELGGEEVPPPRGK